MKALFISYNQAFGQEIIDLLERHGQRGFTQWTGVGGRGTSEGEPHLGNHAWPVLNEAVLAMVPDGLVKEIADDLTATDIANPLLGMRYFVWNIEQNF